MINDFAGEIDTYGGEYAPAYSYRGFYIPRYMMGAIERYVEKGIPPGDFLTAVICNDLAGAVTYADEINIKNLPAYVAYFYNEAPSLCWGSKTAMQGWTSLGGIQGGNHEQHD